MPGSDETTYRSSVSIHHSGRRPSALNGEHHLVARPAGEGHRALRVGAERLAVVHVEVLELGRQPVHLAEDRRQRELDGLEQREALLVDQALEQPVEVLAVRAVAGDRQAELLALLAELGDRVDLAVVPEDRERLDAAEGRVGVRRVAVVGDDARRPEVGLLHLRVEARDDLGLALHLVERVVCRERGDRAVEVALDLHHRPVAGGGGVPRLARQAGDLPEDRRRLGRARPERAAVDPPLAAPQHLEAVRGEQRLDARHLALGAGRRVEEDVGDREAPVVGGGRVEPRGLQPPAPGRPGQVHHQPAAVALAVDAARAVHHELERRERPLQHRAARPPVAGREGGQRAGVVLQQLGEPARRGGGERRRSGHPRASWSSVRQNMVVDRQAVTVTAACRDPVVPGAAVGGGLRRSPAPVGSGASLE